MVRILIVEDDEGLRHYLKEGLSQAGYIVIEAEDGSDALDLLDQQAIDLMITDVMMPNLDGVTLTSELREVYVFPILMLTALESITDKKKGFLSGADDYLVKPVELEELLLRVNALLRRSNIAREKKIAFGRTVIEEAARVVIYENERIEFPMKEFDILFKLASNPRKIFTRQQLMDDIWGYEAESDLRTIDVHIKRIRKRLEHIEDIEVKTVWGLGYRLEVQK
ncbi:response regulator transcription factor [Jeotgalibacillus sp. R-1-5s-1]|uniref:response regulator transcription factor n=1 Tax=Jeotgalibacillus sp. R-1-5s-1 TaxID=2555897 RepID=UPI0010691AB7|nr:response regulator transcription factor [Jeotgalibacillus sp. R-1-5s-1]TFD94492.1 response regulator transcription factor [Jeotgalibacillus sp. R-1-5s-1]